MKGKLIASGVSMWSMLDFCYRNKLTTENSILEVTDFGLKEHDRGGWELYEKLND